MHKLNYAKAVQRDIIHPCSHPLPVTPCRSHEVTPITIFPEAERRSKGGGF